MQQRLQRRQSFPARALLARICLAHGDALCARDIARAMTQERPDSVMAWALLGDVALDQGELPAARAAYGRVRELRPYSRAYLRGMLAAYAAEGDLVAASGYAVRLLDTAG